MDQMYLTVGSKKIALYGISNSGVPIVYLNTVHDEGEAVWNACANADCQRFIMAAISNLNWHHDMSPWSIPPIASCASACTGGADEYLKLLTETIIPKIEGQLSEKPSYSALAGYSLGGLFAVYAAYQTDAFRRFASASGSFWFPGITEFVKAHQMAAKPDKIYFSIGDKESHTKSTLIATVEQRTKWLAEWYAQKGINTVFVKNPGNHFNDAVVRMSKGICWMLEES